MRKKMMHRPAALLLAAALVTSGCAGNTETLPAASSKNETTAIESISESVSDPETVETSAVQETEVPVTETEPDTAADADVTESGADGDVTESGADGGVTESGADGDVTENETEEGEVMAQNEVNTDFDTSVMEYIRDLYGDRNYMVSPMSFRFALCLLAAGAEGDTKNQILHAAGFADMEEAYRWAGLIFDFSEKFNSIMSDELPEENSDAFFNSFETKVNGGFDIANAVWHNENALFELNDAYCEIVKEKLLAEAASAPADELMNAINSWTEEKTRGLIRDIVSDNVKDMDNVLINALYFKSAWLDSFFPSRDVTDFTLSDGSTVTKEFMTCQDEYLYYEDDDTRLIVVPMYGNVDVVFVDGDAADLSEKVSQAEYTLVHFTLPKFETETTFDQQELVSFLSDHGAGIAFTDDADFSPMSEGGQLVSDIVQKTKISVDEDGMEAAAVTAMMMAMGFCPEEDPPQPIEFTLDHSFSYYVFANVVIESLDMRFIENHLMFAGQLVE